MAAGEGGGVCSAAPLVMASVEVGTSSSAGEPTLERGEETGESGSSPSWERFNFLVGGNTSESELAGVLRVGRWTRDELGTWMPSDGRESDLRRVL